MNRAARLLENLRHLFRVVRVFRGRPSKGFESARRDRPRPRFSTISEDEDDENEDEKAICDF